MDLAIFFYVCISILTTVVNPGFDRYVAWPQNPKLTIFPDFVLYHQLLNVENGCSGGKKSRVKLKLAANRIYQDKNITI